MSITPYRGKTATSPRSVALAVGTLTSKSTARLKKDAKPQNSIPSIRRIAAGLAPPQGGPGAEYAAAKGVIQVIDDETGEILILNTKTAVDLALERGDEDDAGAFSNSALGNTLPLLAEDAEKSATLHMYILSQQERIGELSKAQRGKEFERVDALVKEPMVWRKKRMERDFALDRLEEALALERARVEEDKAVLKTAHRMGLL